MGDRAGKGTQGHANIVNREAMEVGSQGSGQDILDHKESPPREGDGDISCLFDPQLPAPLEDGDITVFVNGSSAPVCNMCLNQGVIDVEAKVGNLGFGALSHGGDEGIIGIEDGVATFNDSFSQHSFDFGHIIEGVDATQTEVISGNIQDNTNVTFRKANTFAEDAAAGGFKDSGFDGWVAQDNPGAVGAGHIAFGD